MIFTLIAAAAAFVAGYAAGHFGGTALLEKAKSELAELRTDLAKALDALEGGSNNAPSVGPGSPPDPPTSATSATDATTATSA